MFSNVSAASGARFVGYDDPESGVSITMSAKKTVEPVKDDSTKAGPAKIDTAKVDEASSFVTSRLSEKDGKDKNTTQKELIEIDDKVFALSPAERNALIGKLTNDGLKRWNNEINDKNTWDDRKANDSWPSGTGGISDTEEKNLFKNLQEGLDATQLKRVADSFDNVYEGKGGITFERKVDTTKVDDATSYIKDKLNEDGWFNDVTHGELKDITGKLQGLSLQDRNAVISQLSDSELGKWNEEINSGGWFGTGGLDKGEDEMLFNTLEGALDYDQIDRIANSFDNVYEGKGGVGFYRE